jgi:ribonuclease HI
MKREHGSASGPQELLIFVDGASKGNPGPSSIGAVLLGKDGETVKTLSEFIGTATNNTAEYFALIFALQEAVALGAKRVTVKTDSQLMARQFSGEYETREPHVKMLYKLVKRLAKYFDECTVTHIPREENREADRLANRAIEAIQ